MIFRRLLALLMPFATTGSFVEPVIGVLRDGEVHHETSADHCTHQHGPAVVSTFAFAVLDGATPEPLTEPTGHSSRITAGFFHPPRT